MNDFNAIDRFMDTFIRYIDSGFGLLNGEVAYLTATLIGMDITLAGLAWAFDSQANVPARLIKKVLYVGAFAFVLGNFSLLADTIFQSFAGLGLSISASGLTAADLLRPGKLAGTGFEAAWPLLQQAREMVSFTTFFDNIIPAAVLFIAWLIVILAFFVLAVQLFVTVLEFKLTTLAGFVLVPFALWNKSAFLAERVLGNVISSGIKVMVLAVVVGIGAGFFADFTTALNGQEPDLGQAMSLVLAAISVFGIGIFGPGIAAGLVSGAPQLGAGAAVGTAGGLTAGAALAAGGAVGATRMLAHGGMGAVRAGTALSSGASSAYQLGRATSGESGMAGVGAGLAGVARAGAGLTKDRLASAGRSFAAGASNNIQAGHRGAWRSTGGSGAPSGSSAMPQGDNGPEWAQRLRSEQRMRHQRQATVQAIKDGDKNGGAANPDLREDS